MAERKTSANAFIGMIEYKDGSAMPCVLLDISKDEHLQERAKEMYSDRKLKKITLHIEPSGEIRVEGIKELLDGNLLEDLILRFIPEVRDDIDMFLGYVELTFSWVMVVRLDDKEYHFIVSADSDEIMYRYGTPKRSEFKRFEGLPA